MGAMDCGVRKIASNARVSFLCLLGILLACKQKSSSAEDLAIRNKGLLTTQTLTAVPVRLEKNLGEMNIGYCFFVTSQVNGLDWSHTVPLNAMPVHYAAFTAGVIEQSNLEKNFKIGHYALWGAVDVLFAASLLRSTMNGAYKATVSGGARLEKLLKPGEFDKLKKLYLERGAGYVGTEKYLDWQSAIHGNIRPPFPGQSSNYFWLEFSALQVGGLAGIVATAIPGKAAFDNAIKIWETLHEEQTKAIEFSDRLWQQIVQTKNVETSDQFALGVRAIQTAFHGQYGKKALFYSLPFTKNICNDQKNRVIGKNPPKEGL